METVNETPVEVAVPVETVTPPTPPELPEFTYSYEIKDDEGNTVGGKQVRKYRAEKELPVEVFSDAIEAHRQATLALRNLKRKQVFEVPDASLTDVQRAGQDIVTFTPRTLTPEEHTQLSRDLLDPVKADAARKTITEAELGAPLSRVGEVLNRQQEKNLQLQAKVEVADFLSNNRSYYKCHENFKKITDYMVVNNLAPISSNFQKAYDVLLADGFLQTAPTVREEPVVQDTLANAPAQVVAPSGITNEPPVANERPIGIPSGLNRSNSSDTGTVQIAQQRTYTKAEIDKMSGDEYRKLVVEPEFRARRAALTG